MRTLKKSLALVLALVMVLGLGVVGASAKNAVDSYTDVSKVGAAYTEAVGVMVGLGIIDGVKADVLEPQGTFTREMAAKIVCYMMLGKDRAESLTCTKSPFVDVAADRWSAGYIQYCYDKGILNGVDDAGNFNPTGVLTGTAWAKMLLCAVGYGVKGEYQGTTWSVKTSMDALKLGLFDGDLKANTDSAITREQAILLGFTGLTELGQVTYSIAVGDYIYEAYQFETVTPKGWPLAATVWGLEVDSGIIVDNEARGARFTYVWVDTRTVNGVEVRVYERVSTDTALKDLYHAVRVWHIDETCVYLVDLATTAEYECLDIAAAKADAQRKHFVAKDVGDEALADYEAVKVDNPVGYPDYFVTYNYDLDVLGKRVAKTSTVEVPKGVDNTLETKYVATDISGIKNNDPIIYLVATSDDMVEVNAVAKRYVYGLSGTVGTISKIQNKTDTITLTDGRVIKKSVFCEEPADEILDGGWNDNIYVGKTYYITLDSHGHYISLVEQTSFGLYYATGAYKAITGAYNGAGETKYSVQFVNVTTGEVVDVPVYSAFVYPTATAAQHSYVNEFAGKYYELGVADSFGVYTPEEPEFAANGMYSAYNKQAELTVTAGNNVYAEDVLATNPKDDDIIYNRSKVEFILVSGAGSSVKVTKLTGNAALLAAYSANTLSVTLGDGIDVVATCSTTVAGNVVADVIFAVTSAYDAGILYLPYDLDVDDHDEEVFVVKYGGDEFWNYVYEDVAVLNGSEKTFDIVLGKESAPNEKVDKGFYSYYIDWLGRTVLTPIPDGAFGVVEATEHNAIVETDRDTWYLVTENGRIPFAPDAKVLELRASADRESFLDDVTAIHLDSLFEDYLNAIDGPYTIAYQVVGGQIVAAYVVIPSPHR